MLIRSGLLLAFYAVFLQIAVFLQPLLPVQYQIAPVCETITHTVLLAPVQTLSNAHGHHDHHAHNHQDQHSIFTEQLNLSGHQHDMNHQCQYCTVYGNLILPPALDVEEVFVRLQIRLIAFQKAYTHVWFVLQQLFLIPQGRAPPAFA